MLKCVMEIDSAYGAEYVTISYPRDGVMETKCLTLDEYLKIFKSSCVLKRRFGPLNQSNIYDVVVTEFNTSYFVEVPAAKRGFVFGDGQAYIIPYPRIFFNIIVANNGSCDLMCYALPDGELTDATPLLRYPFSHVSSEGHVCVGGNAVTCHGTQDIPVIIDTFFSAPNYDHYYSGDTNKSGLSLQDLILELRNKETFPKEYLNDLPLTIGSLIKESMA